MRGLLDDGPLGLLAQHYDPTWRWPADALHVMEAVAKGAALDKSGRRQEILAMVSAGGDACARVHRLITGTPAEAYLHTHLRPLVTRATKDLGEYESIAWCLHEASDATFATTDKGAAYLALSELGPNGRVSSPYDLWKDLHTSGLLTVTELTDLCLTTAKVGSPTAPPPRIAS